MFDKQQRNEEKHLKVIDRFNDLELDLVIVLNLCVYLYRKCAQENSCKIYFMKTGKYTEWH